MKIDILNSAGNVIAMVDGVRDGDAEFASNYESEFTGAVSWRVHVRPGEETLAITRRDKIAETVDHAINLIGAVVPALNNWEMIDLIVELMQAGAFAAGFPTPGSDMERVKDIYQYAKTSVNQSRTATQAQLDNYDPATDPNWP